MYFVIEYNLLTDWLTQNKYIFEMLTADPLNVCEIMFNWDSTRVPTRV